jgi:hypothetical protein
MTKQAPPEAPDQQTCPVPATHDKFFESHYFLDQMLFSYHEPQHFGWNLNAFLQALRSVTLMLQAELTHHKGFQEWYSKEQELMRGDALLKRFLDGRNFVVHQGMLRRRSHVQAGFFRGRTCKLALGFPLDVDIPTRELLAHVVRTNKGMFVPEDHPFIGEQLGVKRSWRVEDLGDEDVVTLANTALHKIGMVVYRGHEFLNRPMQGPPEEIDDPHDVESVNVLLETDVDPSLAKKWGWD